MNSRNQGYSRNRSSRKRESTVCKWGHVTLDWPMKSMSMTTDIDFIGQKESRDLMMSSIKLHPPQEFENQLKTRNRDKFIGNDDVIKFLENFKSYQLKTSKSLKTSLRHRTETLWPLWWLLRNHNWYKPASVENTYECWWGRVWRGLNLSKPLSNPLSDNTVSSHVKSMGKFVCPTHS